MYHKKALKASPGGHKSRKKRRACEKPRRIHKNRKIPHNKPMKNTYAFIAGNHPALSATEIASRWPQAKISTTGEVIFVASKAAIEIEPRALETLGGSTKLIRVLTVGKKPSPQELLKYIPRGTGKIQLGISVYPETVKEIKTLPLGLSKIGRASCR